MEESRPAYRSLTGKKTWSLANKSDKEVLTTVLEQTVYDLRRVGHKRLQLMGALQSLANRNETKDAPTAHAGHAAGQQQQLLKHWRETNRQLIFILCHFREQCAEMSRSIVVLPKDQSGQLATRATQGSKHAISTISYLASENLEAPGRSPAGACTFSRDLYVALAPAASQEGAP